MSKIYLNPARSKRLEKLCKDLEHQCKPDDPDTFYKIASHLGYVCDDFTDTLNDCSDFFKDLCYAISIYDIDSMLDAMEQLKNLINDINEEYDSLKTTTEKMIIAFDNATEKSELQILLTQEEIDEIIKNNYVENSILALEIKDDKVFNLIFFKADDETETPFFSETIAIGKEQDLPEVQKLLERFF